ncbi:MAG: ATP-binding cassette domain-containing protein, partial [Phenylobacterium sp.]|nr:ATP-binding cassette domain-containing protein [Phenylobacterium sp.]
GPSGAGKTTLLRVVAGLIRPGEGRIACAGETWLDTAAGIFVPPFRRRTGLVFQAYALLPHMTALQNILMAMGDRPRDQRREEGLRLMAALDLSGLEDRKPANLSGGQQQRVAMARALARRPAVLLLDEPLSAVDRRSRRRVRDQLSALREAKGPPILLVTHDLEEAAGLADRVAVMDAGRILRCGPPAQVLADPQVAEVLDLG